MTQTQRLVTVLLCTYNDEIYIAETIQSILNQSYTNYEFIILNDGSTDETKKIILTFQDDRIKYLEHSENRGLEEAKNWGLKEARGKYIAYMDGDDISEPDRLMHQVEFMETHPEVGICSTRKRLFGLQENMANHVEYDIQLRTRALFATPMEHPSCMVRTATIRQHNIQYRIDFPIAEDYPFMVDMMQVSKAYCIQEPLIRKRIHDQRISVTKKEIQKESAAKASKMAFRTLLGIEAGKNERFALKRSFFSKSNAEDLPWLKKLKEKITLSDSMSEEDLKYRKHITDLLTRSISQLQLRQQETQGVKSNVTKYLPLFIKKLFKNENSVKVNLNNLPVLGMVLTFKNEAAILRHNIEYHRFMGVSHFYLFDDGSTDGSMATVPDMAGVHKSMRTNYSNLPPEMEAIKKKAIKGNWMGRQLINAYNALQMAKRHKVDWLLFIDADELIIFEDKEKGAFRRSFASIESEIDVVHFDKVYEVVQQKREDPNIFRAAKYFKTMNYSSVTREILDPMLNKMITLKGFMGHVNGKQAARVNANLMPVSAHNFKTLNQKTPKVKALGSVLHYHGGSFSEFIKQNSIPHPSHFIFGKEVPYYPKLFWRKLVMESGLSIEQLRRYYEKWIIYDDSKILQMKEQDRDGEPFLIEISGVQEIWKKIMIQTSEE